MNDKADNKTLVSDHVDACFHRALRGKLFATEAGDAVEMVRELERLVERLRPKYPAIDPVTPDGKPYQGQRHG